MNKKVRVAVIEDEKPAARLLRDMIAALRPEWEIEVLPGNIAGAAAWFATHEHPELLFLDIHLSDGNSFLFIEQARPESRIVFTTAYDRYAVQAFTVNSIDYLLKPIRSERLAETIGKYESIAVRRQEELLGVLRSLAAPEKQYRTRFLISGASGSRILPVSEIALFHTEEKVTCAVTFSGREHVVDLPLDKLSEQLDPREFFRANRQTIVCIRAITRIEPYFQNKIVVHTDPEFHEKILVSREKAGAFKLWLNY